MQTDLTAFLLYAIRRPSRDITMEWPSSRRKRKHTQGFGNREPRCQSSGLLGKLKTDSRISERIAFCRVSGWRGLTVKAWFKLLGVVSFRGCTGLKPLAKLDKTVFHSGFTFHKRPHAEARVETRMQLTVDAQKMCLCQGNQRYPLTIPFSSKNLPILDQCPFLIKTCPIPEGPARDTHL